MKTNLKILKIFLFGIVFFLKMFFYFHEVQVNFNPIEADYPCPKWSCLPDIDRFLWKWSIQKEFNDL